MTTCIDCNKPIKPGGANDGAFICNDCNRKFMAMKPYQQRKHLLKLNEKEKRG